MATEHAFLLHGHHPHVIQGLERFNDALITYSLGNFCTDEHTSWSIQDMVVKHTPENQQSFMLGVTIENHRILEHKVMPIAAMGIHWGWGSGSSESDFRLLDEAFRPIPRAQTRPSSNCAEADFANSLNAWILRRLNYHFVGAYLKRPEVTGYRYRGYFGIIRRKASEKNILRNFIGVVKCYFKRGQIWPVSTYNFYSSNAVPMMIAVTLATEGSAIRPFRAAHKPKHTAVQENCLSRTRVS